MLLHNTNNRKKEDTRKRETKIDKKNERSEMQIENRPERRDERGRGENGI